MATTARSQVVRYPLKWTDEEFYLAVLKDFPARMRSVPS
jgi:hypothetical protein